MTGTNCGLDAARNGSNTQRPLLSRGTLAAANPFSPLTTPTAGCVLLRTASGCSARDAQLSRLLIASFKSRGDSPPSEAYVEPSVRILFRGIRQCLMGETFACQDGCLSLYSVRNLSTTLKAQKA
jgi:hypothetical protein